MMTFWADLRPQFLNYWLRNLQSKAHDLEYSKPQIKQCAEGELGQYGKQILKGVS
jgi:hypothetical protein